MEGGWGPADFPDLHARIRPIAHPPGPRILGAHGQSGHLPVRPSSGTPMDGRAAEFDHAVHVARSLDATEVPVTGAPASGPPDKGKRLGRPCIARRVETTKSGLRQHAEPPFPAAMLRKRGLCSVVRPDVGAESGMPAAHRNATRGNGWSSGGVRLQTGCFSPTPRFRCSWCAP